ncbi:MAG: STAS domain-containing protein [Acidobacteriaceae bacterium]|jgi:anti-anti-sigma factor
MALRITIQQNADTASIRLEGRITGPWATELRNAWETWAPSLGRRKLSLDLRNTTYADSLGIRVLREIYSQTDAELGTSSPWTQYLADEITRKSANANDEEY